MRRGADWTGWLEGKELPLICKAPMRCRYGGMGCLASEVPAEPAGCCGEQLVWQRRMHRVAHNHYCGSQR
jgi:hypothetical protein